MTHYTVQFNSVMPELATVSSLERKRFQGTLIYEADNELGLGCCSFMPPVTQ